MSKTNLTDRVCAELLHAVVEKSTKDGNNYVNNEFKKIITPDDEEYLAGEWISDKPLPIIPEAGESSQKSSTAAPIWGAPAADVPAQQSPPALKASSAMPPWASK